MSIKQATLNRHVNLEAVRAYVARFPRWIDRIESYEWPEEPTAKQADAISALRRAEAALTLALDLCGEAEQKATAVDYDRLYHRTTEA